MIHITAQMRVLVAIEPVDGRKGIDSFVRFCPEPAQMDDPNDWLCFCVQGDGEARRFGYSAMTARDTGLPKSVFPKGGSHGGRNRTQLPNDWRLTKPSC